MKHKDILNHIEGKEDTIIHLLLDRLEETSIYSSTLEEVEEILYNISTDEACHIVKEMQPFGEHWSIEEVKEYISSKGISHNCTEYYLCMNMAYNDYYSVATKHNIENITEFSYDIANAFINDEDAKPHKVMRYFK